MLRGDTLVPQRRGPSDGRAVQRHVAGRGVSELAFHLDRLRYRRSGTDPLDRKDAIAIDAHPVSGFMCFRPATNEANRNSGHSALAVLEVVDIAEQKCSILSRVIEVTEVRLAIQKEHGGHAFGTEERERAEIQVRGYEDP